MPVFVTLFQSMGHAIIDVLCMFLVSSCAVMYSYTNREVDCYLAKFKLKMCQYFICSVVYMWKCLYVVILFA